MKDIVKIIISLILFIISFFIKNNYIYYIIIYLVYILLTYKVLINIFDNFKNKTIFDENLLMFLATIGALILNETKEAVAIMLFYQIGEYIESLATYKSEKSIIDLLDLKTENCYLKKDGKLKKINTSEIKINDTLSIKPGDKIPVDCEVINGNSSIDTSSITGEYKPKSVDIGDTLLSGSINLTGLIEVKAIKTLENSTSSIILNLILKSNEKKSKQEKFIMRFAKVYTPIVIFLSVLLVLIPFILQKDLNVWLYKSLLFLVSSCPCALVISVPLAYFLAIANCSKQGLIIKGSFVIDLFTKIKTVVLDKTGTITKGNFKVTKIIPFNKSKEEILKIAAYSEFYSNHPIATAIKEEYQEKIDEKLISNYKEISGKGVTLKIKNEEIVIGNNLLFEEKNIKYPKIDFIGTVVLISMNNEYIGTIVISDEIKKSSLNIVNKLKQNGIKKIIMLSGDNEEIVKKVSQKLQIDESFSNLLPQDKLEKIKEIKMNDKVMFVGDGINDALVLLESDIGISMGQIGSDAAIEASDVILMNDDLEKIISALKISKRTSNIVKFNIVFSIFIKILVLLLLFFDIANMWVAVFTDVGITLITIINDLRILKGKFAK